MTWFLVFNLVCLVVLGASFWRLRWNLDQLVVAHQVELMLRDAVIEDLVAKLDEAEHG